MGLKLYLPQGGRVGGCTLEDKKEKTEEKKEKNGKKWERKNEN